MIGSNCGGKAVSFLSKSSFIVGLMMLAFAFETLLKLDRSAELRLFISDFTYIMSIVGGFESSSFCFLAGGDMFKNCSSKSSFDSNDDIDLKLCLFFEELTDSLIAKP